MNDKELLKKILEEQEEQSETLKKILILLAVEFGQDDVMLD